MCIQDPPVYMETHFKKKKTFNKDLYKPYLHPGELYDYLVWPLLQLYKGGPVLSKGIAEGRPRKRKKKKNYSLKSRMVVPPEAHVTPSEDKPGDKDSTPISAIHADKMTGNTSGNIVSPEDTPRENQPDDKDMTSTIARSTDIEAK